MASVTTDTVLQPSADQSAPAQVLDLAQPDTGAEPARVRADDTALYSQEMFDQFVANSRTIRAIVYDQDGAPAISMQVNGIPAVIPTGVAVDIPELFYNTLKDNAAAVSDAERRRTRMVELGRLTDARQMPSLDDVKQQNRN